MSLLGSSQMTAAGPEKADSAAESASVLVEAIRDNLTPATSSHASPSRTRSPW